MLIALALNTSYLIVGFCNYNFNHDYVLQLTQRTLKNAAMDSTEPMSDSSGIPQTLQDPILQYPSKHVEDGWKEEKYQSSGRLWKKA